MSIDQRCRLYSDVRDLSRDEVFDELLPAANARNGGLAARGIRLGSLGSLQLSVGDRDLFLRDVDGELVMSEGEGDADLRVVLDSSALSDLVQDVKSAMGLAMNSRVELEGGGIPAWIGWEPVFRALLDGRPVYEPEQISMTDRHGEPLRLATSFSLEDDPADIARFLEQAGFLHVRGVFSAGEMAAVGRDLDEALASAEPDDGASWWAGDSSGRNHAVRVLFFQERSEVLRRLLDDERLQWLARLTGDDYVGGKMAAEGLIKPLDIVSGLSDLPWHKDCGQGGHSYSCNGLTVGISVTGAGRRSGALGVVPGSHRANVQTARLDPRLDLEPLMLETETGDITVHCSDTLHKSHRPKERTRKVVYTGFRLAPKPGDHIPEVPRGKERAARARLTNVRDRISAAERD